MESMNFGGDNMVVTIISLIIVAIAFASLWRIFEKAGKTGWHALVPILNVVVLCQIAGRPGWWAILFFIPIVGIVMPFIVYIDLAKRFGKDALYGVGMVLLSFIFVPMLAFGDAKYTGTPAEIV